MLLEGQAGSVGEVLSEVVRICGRFKANLADPEEIWFRGQSSCEWSLRPELYRPSLAKYHYDEAALHDRFISLASPIVSRVPRIVAQQGMFTVHGHERISLDTLAGEHEHLRLARIQLDRSRIAFIAEELRIAGVNKFSIFPDLDSLAKYVCWIYQSAI